VKAAVWVDGVVVFEPLRQARRELDNAFASHASVREHASVTIQPYDDASVLAQVDPENRYLHLSRPLIPPITPLAYRCREEGVAIP